MRQSVRARAAPSSLALPKWTFLVSLLISCAPSSESQAPALERPASAASVASVGDLRPEPDDDDNRPAVMMQNASAAVAPAVDSDLASVFRGGGCYPPAITTAGLDQLILVDPEWAPVENGRVVESTPVLIHGTVVDSHGDRGGDFPATHVQNDQNTFIRLDNADSGRLATGNTDGLLDLEWEVGAFPDWAWASPGDRLVALGRWIFDCGHPNPVLGTCSGSGQPCILSTDCGGAACNGAHFGYRTEMHPPQAVAVLRPPQGAVIRSGSRGEDKEQADRDDGEPQLATRADVFVSEFGGAVGDRCILTHRNSIPELIGAECFPLSDPVAPINDVDFSFDLPLPPRPRRASKPVWAITPHTTPGAHDRATLGAEVAITPVLNVAEPHLAVTVRMSHAIAGRLPTGFAASITAGWQRPREEELKHLRVFIEGIEVRNPLKPPGGLVVGRSAPGWRAQVAVNGSWRQLSGLQDIKTAGFVAQSPPLVIDLFLARGGALRIQADGASSACVDTMFGQSIGDNLSGFDDPDPSAPIICLNTVAQDPGTVDAWFSGPRFGARHAPYQTLSLGGQGQLCTGQKTLACTRNADCPAGETCAGAFALQYRIVEADSD